MAPSASAPLYQPLDPSKSQIRLLQIHRIHGPKPHQDKITYTLSTVSLHDKPKFTALSYVWGNPKITKPITVNNHTVDVTTNLAAGLRCLVKQLAGGKDTLCSFQLWIDAICVNQEDVTERNHQVKLMRDVYSSAEHVFAWLGIPKKQEARKSLSRGLGVINTVYEAIKDLSYDEFSDLSWAPRCPFLTRGSLPYSSTVYGIGGWNARVAGGAVSCVEKNWLAVDELLRLPYWRRVWIVQETAFARSLVLFCETGILHAHKLEFFGDYFGRFQKHAMESVLVRPPFIKFDCWWYMTAPDGIDYSPTDRLLIVREHAQRTGDIHRRNAPSGHSPGRCRSPRAQAVRR